MRYWTHGEKRRQSWPMKRPLCTGFLKTAAENSILGLTFRTSSKTWRVNSATWCTRYS